jgi:putative MATE family efflux protein
MLIGAISRRFQQMAGLVRESLSGEQQDYTAGSIRRSVILLSIPMVLEMCMESVFAVVDIFFVGHLGKHATSVVGLSESMITIVYSLAIGVSMAATAIVARRVGEKHLEAAGEAGMQAMLFAIVITIFISIPGFFFAPRLLEWMGAEPEAVRLGSQYTRILLGGSMVVMLLFLLNGIFRGAGDAMMAMKSLWVANIANIILCPLLIRGWGPVPAYGLTGAAMATTIGRGIGVCYQLFHLFNGKQWVKFHWAKMKPDAAVIRSIFAIAWPATVQFLIGSGSWIVLASLVVKTGQSTASAGYQIAIRMVIFFLLPAWGMSNAAATLVGQNLGANQPGRAEASVKQTARYTAYFMAMVSVFLIAFAPWLAAFFTTDEQVQAYAVLAVRVLSAGYVFYGIGMVMVNAFNGAGDTQTPTFINLFCFWLFQVPLAWLLSTVWKMGPTGVFVAVPIAETAIALVAWYLFRQGKWKLKKV